MMTKQEEKKMTTSRLMGISEPRRRRRVMVRKLTAALTSTARFEEDLRFAHVALVCRACKGG